MNANEQDSGGLAGTGGGKGRMARLHVSPYLLKPLRSLDQAARDAKDKGGDDEKS